MSMPVEFLGIATTNDGSETPLIVRHRVSRHEAERTAVGPQTLTAVHE
jgi:hypothetical protein